jgi:hypothetical protein
VVWIQRPFANRKKSSPAFTEGSMPLRSRPCPLVEERGPAAGDVGFDGAEEQATATARRANLIFMAAHPATVRVDSVECGA